MDWKNGNVFGGYTQLGWIKEKNSDWSSDKDAFVFQVRSSKGYAPILSNVKQNELSISDALGYNNFSFGVKLKFFLFH